MNLLRDGTLQTLPAELLVTGDVRVLAEGDRVPADCRVIEAFYLPLNLAAVTGESVPQSRNAAPDLHRSALAARKLLLVGTLVQAGSAGPEPPACARDSAGSPT